MFELLFFGFDLFIYHDTELFVAGVLESIVMYVRSLGCMQVKKIEMKTVQEFDQIVMKVNNFIE